MYDAACEFAFFENTEEWMLREEIAHQTVP
jgi:hypothetical protein